MAGVHSKSSNPSTRSLLPLLFSSAGISAVLVLRFYRNYTHKRSKPEHGTLVHRSLIISSNSNPQRQSVPGDLHQAGKSLAVVQISSLHQFLYILKLINVGYIESGQLAFITLLLITRSFADVWMIYLGTLLESAIITKNPTKFKHHLLQFALTIPSMTLVNSLLKCSTESLSLSLRNNLTTKILTKYLSNLTFYKLNSLDIISDIDKFSSSLISIYSQLTKPIMDIGVYVYGISRNIGISVPAYMMSYLVVAAAFLIRLRKPISSFTSMEQALEGGFRTACSRIGTNAEEIAFYGGQKWELKNLLGNFGELVKHLMRFGEFRFVNGYAENFIAKYMATVVGYFAVSRPFFKISSLNPEERLETYYKSGRMLVNLAQAIGKVVINGKEVSRLTGYSKRIYELLEKLETDGNNNSKVTTGGPGRYKVQDDVIRFERVPIITPKGDVLLKELNLTITPGKNLIICGPNGAGKSSLFRILSELWPIQAGTLTKPSAQLFYIPQKPYLVNGTLRDQIIYPQSVDEMNAIGRTDQDLESILKLVELEWLMSPRNFDTQESSARCYSFDVTQNWTETLSGGEKQRLAMARLLYHKPTFAILDECTSALSLDIEDKVYSYCKSVGITLVTVSHRKSLWKHHEYYLYMDGKGGSQYGKITSETNIFGN